MFAINERVSPCSARSSPRSVGRLTTRLPSSRSVCIRAGTFWLSSPSGPFTCTRPGEIATLTPLGSSIGCFPIRLMQFSPDEADHLAADALLLRGTARDQTVRGGQDRDAHAAEDARQPVLACVDAAARLRHPLQVRDHALAAAAVLEVDDERLVGAAVLDVVVANVALLLEQAGDLLLDPRVRHLHVVVERAIRVADSAEHVGNGISQHRFFSSVSRAKRSGQTNSMENAQHFSSFTSLI